MPSKPAGSIKPIDGQLSLLSEPPVRYCRRCGRRLRNAKSQACRLGPRCQRKEREKSTDDPAG